MCLAVIGRVIEVKDIEAMVNIRGVKRKVNIALVDDVKVGDWVVVHVGFAIRKMTEREARETEKLWEEVLRAV